MTEDDLRRALKASAPGRLRLRIPTAVGPVVIEVTEGDLRRGSGSLDTLKRFLDVPGCPRSDDRARVHTNTSTQRPGA